MDSITLVEHEQKEVNLSNIEVDTLRKFFPKQLDVWPTQEPGRYLVKAHSYAGMIILPTEKTIYINPKLPIQTLFALLAKVYDPNKEIFDDQPQPYTTVNELFEFIVSFFAGHTEDLIARGLLRGYQSLVEDSQAIRGRLLIAETIHHNPGLQHKHWCSYRHFTTDIPENRVLLWTAFVLRGWNYVDVSLFGRLHRIQHILSDVYLDPLARTLIDRLEFHRLNDAYKPALTLAKLILDYLTFSGSQGNEPFLAYLIDMDVLFQQYLSTILRQETEQSRYWTKEEENHSLDLGKKITIRPDILIYLAAKMGEQMLLPTGFRFVDGKFTRAYASIKETSAAAARLGMFRQLPEPNPLNGSDMDVDFYFLEMDGIPVPFFLCHSRPGMPQSEDRGEQSVSA